MRKKSKGEKPWARKKKPAARAPQEKNFGSTFDEVAELMCACENLGYLAGVIAAGNPGHVVARECDRRLAATRKALVEHAKTVNQVSMRGAFAPNERGFGPDRG